MKNYTLNTILLLLTFGIAAQEGEEGLPYHSIPPYPPNYTPGTVVARVIDGLGFRYYWATEGLTAKDLNYRVTTDSRSIRELMYHIHGLSEIVLSAAAKQPIDRRKNGRKIEDATLLRAKTLRNLKTASDLMSESTDMDDHPLIFVTENDRSRFPFWNQLNGPVEDAVWHSGQIAMIRRASGNPINAGVDVFLGVTKN